MIEGSGERGAEAAGSRRDREAPKGGPDEAALSARLERLGASLEARRAAEDRETGGRETAGIARAVKIASEFVAGVVVGGALGWGIDRALGTAPWALIVFVLLGFAAGVLNVLRAEGMVADAGARLRAEARKSGSSSSEIDR